MTWEPIAIVAVLWFAAGMTCASTLYRRDHDGWHWMFICGLAGPLAFLVAADQARTVERDTRPRTIARTGTPRDGITERTTRAPLAGSPASPRNTRASPCSCSTRRH